MKVLLVAATEAEIAPLKAKNLFPTSLYYANTGIGMLAAGVNVTRAIIEVQPDLMIQAGIAGAFNNGPKLGEVVMVNNEHLADLGVFESGAWKDQFDMGLTPPSATPFTNRSLPCPYVKDFNFLNLEAVTAVTVNEISTNSQRIGQIIQKYQPAVESMEGAAFHYSGLQAGLPFIQLRAISNLVGERDKTRWRMKESIAALNATVEELITRIKHLST